MDWWTPVRAEASDWLNPRARSRRRCSRCTRWSPTCPFRRCSRSRSWSRTARWSLGEPRGCRCGRRKGVNEFLFRDIPVLILIDRSKQQPQPKGRDIKAGRHGFGILQNVAGKRFQVGGDIRQQMGPTACHCGTAVAVVLVLPLLLLVAHDALLLLLLLWRFCLGTSPSE